MTDREPLRVGPLVLRWDGACWSFLRMGNPGGACQRILRRVFVVQRDASTYFATVGGAGTLCSGGHATKEDAAAEILRHLTETGYLAQYRSRRRLLAEKAERRARGLESWVSGAAMKRVENKLQVDCFRALDIVRLDQNVRAGKLRALAERLRS